MNLDTFSLGNLFFAFIIALLLHFFFIRKHIISFLDPWLFMFLNQIMILSVMIYSMMMHEINTEHFYYVVASWFAFILGLSTFYKENIELIRCRSLLKSLATNIALKVYLVIFFFNCGFIFYFMGIPLFENGPRNINAFSELGSGFGIFYYLNWGLQSIIILLSIKTWLVDHNKRLAFIAIFSVIIFNTLNGGSRAGYLQILMFISLGMYYMKRNNLGDYKMPKIFKFAIVLLPLIIVASFISAVNSGYEDNIFFAIMKRTIGASEGPFYYFIANSFTYFKGLNLFSYHFSQILPYFGYVDKNAIDLGVNLTLYSDFNMGRPGYGPNPTMYVIGNIALHNFGIFYCFIIGSCLSYFRYRLKASFLVWMCLNTTAITLVEDGTLMPLTLFYLLILSPIIIFSIAITQRQQSVSKHSIE